MAPSQAAKERVEKLRKKIDNAAILMFSKTYCPHCSKVFLATFAFSSSLIIH